MVRLRSRRHVDLRHRHTGVHCARRAQCHIYALDALAAARSRAPSLACLQVRLAFAPDAALRSRLFHGAVLELRPDVLHLLLVQHRHYAGGHELLIDGGGRRRRSRLSGECPEALRRFDAGNADLLQGNLWGHELGRAVRDARPRGWHPRRTVRLRDLFYPDRAHEHRDGHLRRGRDEGGAAGPHGAGHGAEEDRHEGRRRAAPDLDRAQRQPDW
mmetsp:Transcript_19038/g.55249  ORF Transcript_19038/g.55249 Transcript_19038/m.55249 type:complete len:215 (+) Transcript_19038:854-1498(+)